MKLYKTGYSSFFLAYAKNSKRLLPDFVKMEFEKIAEGQSWIFCADNFKGLPVDIGYRHENGDGVYLRIEKGAEYISFETDEMSGIPVFWLKVDGKTIIASSLDLLINLSQKLDIKLKLDLQAGAEFLIAGYVFTYPKTLIKDVFLLSPDNKLSFDIISGEVKTERIGDLPSYSTNRLPKDSAPRLFREALENGFKRHKGKKIALLLSGGGSSRILASCGIAAGLDIDFFTFGQSTVNDSDFSIANKVAYGLGAKTKCFSTSGSNFLLNWKKNAAYANWTNDSVWWSGRIPDELFDTIKNYDLLIRGDGDGCYGWGGNLCSIDDILHRFEITPPAVVWRYKKFFTEPDTVLIQAISSRQRLVKKYESLTEDLVELKNILYRDVRECHGASPGVWYFSQRLPVDAPFLWHDSLKIAFSVPSKQLIVRWLIFAALELDEKIKKIPFSGSGSWNNRLEFYFTGVWEELIAYIERWSPFGINGQEFRKEFLCPPEVPKLPSLTKQIVSMLKKKVFSSKYSRKFAFKYFSYLVNSSMSERLLIRLAIISNLCEILNEKPDTKIINFNSAYERAQ